MPATAQSQRWIFLGTGTGVGKTFAARGLVELLARRGLPVAGLKPIETGLDPDSDGPSDAAALQAASFHVKLPQPHPLYAFHDPIAPSRAARAAHQSIDLSVVHQWVKATESAVSAMARIVLETAGGVFSPLNDHQTNFDLASVVDPAIWVLVAPDRLGVLHDVTGCLLAMGTLGRSPDYLVLSAPEHPDASTGTNQEELARDPRTPPIIHLPRNDFAPLAALIGPHPDDPRYER